jgi:hypothetical protein
MLDEQEAGLRAVLVRAVETLMLATEGLIAVVDTLDGDTDLEPSLGHSQLDLGRAGVDLEDDRADAEPSLGWTSSIKQEGRNWWGYAGCSGLDGDPEQDDSDREPSLGAINPQPGINPDGIDQTWWGASGSSDGEDGDDMGIGDDGGRGEQIARHYGGGLAPVT